MHCLFAKPFRLIPIAHDPGMRRYRWEHAVFHKPVEPFWLIHCADVLAPAVVWVGTEAMDCDDAE